MKKILFVDDDVSCLKGLKMYFDLRNFLTVTTTSFSGAIQLLDTEEISLVCTDWDLPGGRSGLEILAYARKKNIPVVFLTGHDEDSYERKALDQGAVCYYIKGQISYFKFRDEIIDLVSKEENQFQ